MAACACGGTLTLLKFYSTDEQKAAGVDGLSTRQATFPITPGALDRRKISDISTPCQGFQGVHDDERLQGFVPGTSHPHAPAAATAILEIAFLNGDGRGGTEPRDVRPIIALLVGETGGGSLEEGRDRRRKVALRTCRWDSKCGGDLSPGDW